MAARTRAPRRSRGSSEDSGESRGNRGSSGGGDSNRIEFGAAWINPDDIREPILQDLLNSDGGRIVIAVDQDIEVKEGERIYAFPNDNDNPRAPALDLVIFRD